MNAAQLRAEIDATLDTYRKWIDEINEDAWAQSPAENDWSYAEVYDHIMKSTLGSAIALERCSNSNTPRSKKGLNFWGYYTLYLGIFPPFKTKVPEALAAKMAPKKISQEDARNLIIKARRKVEEVAKLADDAPKNARWEHPRLGMLNAKEWLKFILIHLKHHVKQLERNKKKLALLSNH